MVNNINLNAEMLFDGIDQFSLDNKVIGYIVLNKDGVINHKVDEAFEMSGSAVLPDGRLLGDYHCPSCALRELVAHHTSIDKEELFIEAPSNRYGGNPIALLLAMIASQRAH